MLDSRAIELVIFDCDGVLVDSEIIANEIMRQSLARLGLELSLAQTIERYMGRSLKSCMEMIEAELGRKLPDNFLQDLDTETFAALKTSVEAVPGVAALMDSLDARGTPYCVASSGSFEKMAITLGRTGLLKRLEGRIFSSSQVARGKPFPDLFEFAARQMGKTPGKNCLVVEDSVPGVKAALAAKMQVAGHAAAQYPGSQERLNKAGAWVFSHMEALENALKRI